MRPLITTVLSLALAPTLALTLFAAPALADDAGVVGTVGSMESPSASAAEPRDITQRVLDETTAAQELDLVCQTFCVGNQSRGVLEEVLVSPPREEDGRHPVTARVRLINKHFAMDHVVYDHPVVFVGEGLLDPATCVVTLTGLRVENDFNGLFTMLIARYAEIPGRQEIVPDCQKLLRK